MTTRPKFVYYSGAQNYSLSIGDAHTLWMYDLYINTTAFSNLNINWYVSKNGITQQGRQRIPTPAIAEWI
jgi:hypothetical protein